MTPIPLFAPVQAPRRRALPILIATLALLFWGCAAMPTARLDPASLILPSNSRILAIEAEPMGRVDPVSLAPAGCPEKSDADVVIDEFDAAARWLEERIRVADL
ncbi:MAG: hypothetical protein PVG78_16840 [Desulfobacterales bacterium]|jgi:hypothetical protein